MTKLRTLDECVSLVSDGDIVGLGGNTMHRPPAAFARRLAAAGRRDLELVKTAGAYDIDLLCASGSVTAVHAGYIGFESMGLAPRYRKGVQAGQIRAAEHACYSVIAGMRAAAYGVPFLPIAGFDGSDVPGARGWQRIVDPYGSGQEVVLVPRLQLDVAVLHVHECDEEGNARIYGPVFEDVLMSRAAKWLILTAERIVPRLSEHPVEAAGGEDGAGANASDGRSGGAGDGVRAAVQTGAVTVMPGLLVTAVAHAPKGAAPGSCWPYYDVDWAAVQTYMRLASDDQPVEALLQEAC